MSRGYTIAEVMISLALLGIGASGVVALQKATQIGNTSARTITTANAVAQSWVDRLRADAIQWNNASDLKTETKWLKNADASAPAWFNPEASPFGANTLVGSPSADILGADVFSGDLAEPAFCTKVRLTLLKIFPNPAVTTESSSQIIRAEIRVFWERAGGPIRLKDCSPIPEPGEDGSARYGFVTMTTAVVQNFSP